MTAMKVEAERSNPKKGIENRKGDREAQLKTSPLLIEATSIQP